MPRHNHHHPPRGHVMLSDIQGHGMTYSKLTLNYLRGRCLTQGHVVLSYIRGSGMTDCHMMLSFIQGTVRADDRVFLLALSSRTDVVICCDVSGVAHIAVRRIPIHR